MSERVDRYTDGLALELETVKDEHCPFCGADMHGDSCSQRCPAWRRDHENRVVRMDVE